MNLTDKVGRRNTKGDRTTLHIHLERTHKNMFSGRIQPKNDKRKAETKQPNKKQSCIWSLSQIRACQDSGWNLTWLKERKRKQKFPDDGLIFQNRNAKRTVKLGLSTWSMVNQSVGQIKISDASENLCEAKGLTSLRQVSERVTCRKSDCWTDSGDKGIKSEGHRPHWMTFRQN